MTQTACRIGPRQGIAGGRVRCLHESEGFGGAAIPSATGRATDAPGAIASFARVVCRTETEDVLSRIRHYASAFVSTDNADFF